MIEISDEQFQQMINHALDKLPGEHAQSIKNIAILYAQQPTQEQRIQLQMRHDQLLLGLYEGIPLTKRQGMTPSLPDKITLFKGPLTMLSRDLPDLQERIKHTLWHEIAHYYGLNHQDIGRLE